MRVTENIEFKPSVCPLDCPDTCCLSVGVIDDQVVQVRGSHASPYTAGAICEKVARYYPAFVHGEHARTFWLTVSLLSVVYGARLRR